MKKKFVSIFPSNDRWYLKNSIFDVKKKDEWNRFFVSIRKILEQRNIEINTFDIPSKGVSDTYVFLDLPYPWNFLAWKHIFLNRGKNILILSEPPFIHPFNYMKIFHFFFKKIYTWNDDLLDNEQESFSSKKYFKMYLPKSRLGSKTSPKKFKEKNFLVLINSNKLPIIPFKLISSFGKELYSERIRAIEFFEQKIPDRFYLYGRGWNKVKKYNLKEIFFGYKKYSTYKGEVKNKIKLLSNFKYCLCFENLTDVNGYITEKMFDCFKAKCIPIYWGATNVEKYIPKGCFIDFREFNDFEKLLNFLSSIDERGYNRYIKNIEKLLTDKKFSKIWFEAGFLKFFLEDVLETNRKIIQL